MRSPVIWGPWLGHGFNPAFSPRISGFYHILVIFDYDMLWWCASRNFKSATCVTCTSSPHMFLCCIPATVILVVQLRNLICYVSFPCISNLLGGSFLILFRYVWHELTSWILRGGQGGTTIQRQAPTRSLHSWPNELCLDIWRLGSSSESWESWDKILMGQTCWDMFRIFRCL